MARDDQVRRFYELLHRLPQRRFGDCTGRDEWPSRGVYFFVDPQEEGPFGEGRIVRVGTHAIQDRAGQGTTLWTRLRQHRGSVDGRGNHRGSVFRLLVGDALITRGEYQAPHWGEGTTANRVTRESEDALERVVSEYLGELRVIVVGIEDEPGPSSLRAYVERNSIALLSRQPAGPDWLGHASTRDAVRRSGLWNSDHVDADVDNDFLDRLAELVEGRLPRLQPAGQGEEGSREGDPTRAERVVIRRGSSARSVVVMQCAGWKHPEAGRLRTPEGRPVLFVAHPEQAPRRADGVLLVRPDDEREPGQRWRDYLLEYDGERNPDRLLPAFELYGHPVYRELVESLGSERVFILSAAWGLIPATFLTPDYDLSLSQQAEAFVRRRTADRFDDFRLLPSGAGTVHFVGGRSYVRLFCDLTGDVAVERVIHFRTAAPPSAPGCSIRRFDTATRQNWHYECARWLMGCIDEVHDFATPDSRKPHTASVTADDIRAYVLETYIDPARRRGEATIRVRAGDVHRELDLRNRVPAVCAALDARKFERELAAKVVERDGPPQGTTATWLIKV